MKFIGVIVTSICIAYVTSYGFYSRHQEPEVNDTMFVFPDSERNQCNADSINTTLNIVFDVVFRDEYEDDDSKVLGQQKGNTIYLSEEGETIKVVSHEVSHFVDFVMERNGFVGTESEAYMQGFFTDCVWTLIKNRNE